LIVSLEQDLMKKIRK